ncbi:hypothetical protein LOT_1098 [Lentilactobacillus otakiensis DSM 19908 = JCM 15040]|uniref:Uncharacterized protein n=1 Tax=Lentilactobacillus otakiensis DSM 19908 = JCM 15040 TaxID=1423780 RepID=S4PPN4_9LACO|nr:hypothetical protein LOT_1098 [Lentilactobacillus otakiensis DSM 19908 = JCM 15040]
MNDEADMLMLVSFFMDMSCLKVHSKVYDSGVIDEVIK